MNDCISREEALKHSYIVYDDELERHNVVSVEDIEELPTVKPPDNEQFYFDLGYDSGYYCGYQDAIHDIAESEE